MNLEIRSLPVSPGHSATIVSPPFPTSLLPVRLELDPPSRAAFRIVRTERMSSDGLRAHGIASKDADTHALVVVVENRSPRTARLTGAIVLTMDTNKLERGLVAIAERDWRAAFDETRRQN
jgi:hypothetical protein